MALTISDTEPRVQYTATAGQTSFTVNFEFFDVADLKVFNGTTELTYNNSPSSASQYSVTGAGVSGGGSITLGSPGATLNDTITIYRDLAIARSTDFPVSGNFPIQTLNTELDKIIAMMQQVERDLKFSPKAAATTANTFDITFPNLVANKVLSVNSSGNGLEFSQSIDDIATLAGISSDVTTVSGISANVTTVAGVSSDVTTVATNISKVTTVADNITDVVAVANDLAEAVSEVETVANDLNEATSEIDTVATNITNVNTVGNNIANVNTVAGVSSNVTTVAGVSANVTTVAGISSNVTTVAGISSDVTAVAGKATEVGRLGTADAVADMNTLGTAAIVSDMDTLADISSNITTVAGIASNVTTVANNVTGVNSFADRYRVGSSDPSTSLDEGDLFYNSTDNELKYYNGSAWNSITAGIANVVEDTTPQLGGTLDANGNNIQFDNSTGIADVNNNAALEFQATASAVNELTITNAATGNGPELSSTGSDTNIDLKITPKGTGKINLDGIKFPNADGTSGQVLQTNGSGVLSFADAGGGKIGQVVQVLDATTFSTTSTSYVDVTGVSASITPSSTSSKVLVIVQGACNNSTASGEVTRLKLLRGSTAIGIANTSHDSFFNTYGGSNLALNFTSLVLDSPSTTSATTYKIQVKQSGSSTAYVGGFGSGDEAITTITLMEILA
jgi:hypothetical protein